MAQATEAEAVGGTDGVSIGWRLFQLLGLIVALSWLFSWLVYSQPYGWVGPLLDGELPSWGTVIFDLSPIVSLIVITLAVAPGYLSFMKDGDAKAYVARAIVFLLPALWMLNVFLGPRAKMIDKLITIPLDQSKMVPLYGGVFLHVVMQHWFQSIAAVAFALVPDQFGALTESETPAGIQCAVIHCE